MVEEGLFDRFPCDAVYGAHNDTYLPVGTMVAVAGSVSAASDRFWIRIHGKGGHAARPHRTIDPVVVGSHVVLALQSVVARRVDPQEAAVLSITQFHAGSTGNVIAEEAVLNGTVRTLRPEVQDEVQELLTSIAVATAAAHGAEAVVEYERGYPPVVNAAEPTERAAKAAARVLGEGRVIRERRPGMGGEDFSFMALRVPGCFVRIGQAEGERGSTPVHNPRYDFNDAILPIGASFWSTLVEQELPRG
jgi:hippurate hydrolase